MKIPGENILSNTSKKVQPFAFGAVLGTILGYVLFQQLWVLIQLARRDARRTLAANVNRAPKGITYEEIEEREKYVVRHVIEDGIERIIYKPKEPCYDTPLLFQHGMWHGAWCWWLWQELLAEWGWESHAISLPGHARSPLQRPIALCTLDYYLAFLRDEINRLLPRRPILIGHSMGGAISQWYLKYVGHNLPAVVLVAPWTAFNSMKDGLPRFLKLDPLIAPLMTLSWDATPMVRTPKTAAQKLISKDAVISPQALYEKLGPESALVLYQHNRPFWYPAENVRAPMLWLGGECDVLFSREIERESAAHYGAEYVMIKGAGHNIMMESNYEATARFIHDWLIERAIS